MQGSRPTAWRLESKWNYGDMQKMTNHAPMPDKHRSGEERAYPAGNHLDDARYGVIRNKARVEGVSEYERKHNDL